MTACLPQTEHVADAITAIPSCTLDDAGRRGQVERYRRLGETVARLERTPEALVVEFDELFDYRTLDRALAIERECCPFFVFEFDAAARLLRASVREQEKLPALDALAAALDSAIDVGLS